MQQNFEGIERENFWYKKKVKIKFKVEIRSYHYNFEIHVVIELNQAKTCYFLKKGLLFSMYIILTS